MMKHEMQNSVMKYMSLAIAATIATAVYAVPTINVNSAVQRWPWNNKVDITYTITNGQNLAASEFMRLEFTIVVDGVTHTIDGVKDIGASASSGTHTITWTAPSGVKRTDCTVSAAVYTHDAPSGDDYMVIDLAKTSDNVTFEGLLDSQDASNDRYNTNAVYKTTKLVLRKIPAGGPYNTGIDPAPTNTKLLNPFKSWRTNRAYYIGIFPVTQGQYEQLKQANPSHYQETIAGNVTAHRPVENVSYRDFRDYTSPSTSRVSTVSAPNTGSFLQRLNYITGNTYGFDLPTELMFEIAQRAGTDTVYFWGNSPDDRYFINKGNANGSTVAVGTCKPNDWGIYDTSGNVFEYCRDVWVDGDDPSTRQDVFTPLWVAGNTGRRIRGGSIAQANTASYHKSAARMDAAIGHSSANASYGFRIIWVAE